jgi:hypothetical protein
LANMADFDLELPEDIWNQLEEAGLIEKMSL